MFDLQSTWSWMGSGSNCLRWIVLVNEVDCGWKLSLLCFAIVLFTELRKE